MELKWEPCQCCSRQCVATSAFPCASSLGGTCCSFGSVCLTSNQCTPTVDPATINTVSATPTGCRSDQVSCPAAVGGGCCGVGSTCRALSASQYCVGGGGALTSGGATGTRSYIAGVPTGTPLPPSPDDGAGLSAGAKAGISVGATVAGLSLLTLILWFIMLRRRGRRQQRQQQQQQQQRQRLDPTVPTSAMQSPNGPMSHLSSPTGHSSRPDYFGGDAAPGPYTGNGGDADATGIAANRTAVPVRPQGPADITAPVEMGSSSVAAPSPTSRYPTYEGVPTDHQESRLGAYQESAKGRFELS